MSEHIIRLSNAAGTLQYIITDYLWLTYTKQVNKPGLAQFAIPGDHPAVSSLADKWQVQIKRRDNKNDIDWTTEFDGLYREPEQIDAGPGIFIATAEGVLSMLGWRIVAYTADYTNRSKFASAKAETIMKTLVDYNAGSSATTGNGRLRTGTITGLSVASDTTAGNTVSWYCAYDNLLETLQKLAPISGGDFDLVKTGAATYEFRWYTGQLGTDRTASVLFAVERGNMADPYCRTTRLKEKTVAIVAGQDEKTNRDTVVRTGANYDVNDNNIEVFIDARDVTKGDTSGLNARGDQALKEKQAVEVLEFDVIQVESCAYGSHYFLGDKVSAVSPYSGATVTRKVTAVTFAVKSNGREDIKIELGNE